MLAQYEVNQDVVAIRSACNHFRSLERYWDMEAQGSKMVSLS